jgi:hypothetical protein
MNGRFRPATYKENLFTYHSAERYMVNIKKDEWYLSRMLSAVVGETSVPIPRSAQCDLIDGEIALQPHKHLSVACVDAHATANALRQQLAPAEGAQVPRPVLHRRPRGGAPDAGASQGYRSPAMGPAWWDLDC